jgi:hypothetical protein
MMRPKYSHYHLKKKVDEPSRKTNMKSLQSQMSSGVAYYEGEFYNVVRQGRGVPAVPLIIIGIAP